MAASLGDLLQYTFKGRLFGQQCLNVFYYRVVSVTGFLNDGYTAVADVITDTIIENVRVIQSVDYAWEGYEYRNLTNGIDFGSRTFDAPGLQGNSVTASLPSYVSWTFRLLRESLTTRNGYKRFAGVGEGDVSGNTSLLTAAAINNVTAALAADIYLNLALVAEPVIVKRPIPNPALVGYVYSSVGGADFRGIGSQNTRKPGRGN